MKSLISKSSPQTSTATIFKKITKKECSEAQSPVSTDAGARGATLIHLNFSTARKPRRMPDIVLRRNKISKQIWEQIELAKSRASGTAITITRLKQSRDPVTGATVQYNVPKRIKAWWFTTDAGDLALSIRYGKKLIELAPGKPSILVPKFSELVPLLELIKTAVLAGELDAQLEAAALTLKNGFRSQPR